MTGLVVMRRSLVLLELVSGIVGCKTNLVVDQLDFWSRPLSIPDGLILLQEL
jgi:hypothetical protein